MISEQVAPKRIEPDIEARWYLSGSMFKEVGSLVKEARNIMKKLKCFDIGHGRKSSW